MSAKVHDVAGEIGFFVFSVRVMKAARVRRVTETAIA